MLLVIVLECRAAHSRLSESRAAATPLDEVHDARIRPNAGRMGFRECHRIWVYKVISEKRSYGGYVGFIGYIGYKNLVTIGFIGYIRSGQLRSNRL